MAKYTSADVNHLFFNRINSELTAYTYGFIVGDGNIQQTSKMPHCLQFHLKGSDLQILEDIAEVMKALKGAHLGRDGTAYLSISSKRIVEKLVSCGVIPNKSNIDIGASLYIPGGSLFRHFLRGLIDSDGSVDYYREGSARTCSFTQGRNNSSLVLRVMRLINQRFNLKGRYYENDKFSRVSFEGDKAARVARLLYSESAIKLDRKYRNAVKIMS